VNGDALITGASTNHAQSILNTQLGGYSSVYIEAKSGASVREVGQIFCGGSGGLQLRTNTEHPIKFTTYNNAGSEFVAIQPSMQILADSERKVEILAPLRVKSGSTIIDNTLTVGFGVPPEEVAFAVLGKSLMSGNLQVNAGITCSGDLTVGTTNVSTALADKATKAELALKTNVSRTTNSAVAWSEGLSDGPTHYLTTGTASLAVRTNTGLISADFFGDAGPGGATKDGNITFYKNFEVQGASTATNLTVSGALVVGTTNVATALGQMATPAALDLKAPKASPTFSGTATAADLTVNGALVVGTTNVVSALNLKANTSDVYTKTQIETTLQPKISAFNAPLKYTSNVLTGFNSLSLDPTVFQPVMPWASCLITTASNGTAFVFSFGFQTITTANLTRVGHNDKAYKITFPTPHPNGSLFAVIAVPYTSSSDSWDYTNNTDYICTSKGESSLGMSVWCRRPGQSYQTGLVHGSFYVYTVP
jgi:hypothetical protein